MASRGLRSGPWKDQAAQRRKVEIALALAPNDATRGFGYAAFHLRFRVTVGSELEMELETRNDAQASRSLMKRRCILISPSPIFVRPRSLGSKAPPSSIRPTDSNARTLGNEPLRIAKETDQVHLTLRPLA